MTALLLELLADTDTPDAWVDRALCTQTDPEAFFPDKGGSTREAKAICRTCPVRAQCLQAAMDRDERFGIWGGYSERERRKLAKDPAALAAALTTPPAPPSDTSIPLFKDTPMTDTTHLTRCRWCTTLTDQLDANDLCTDCQEAAATPPAAAEKPAPLAVVEEPVKEHAPRVPAYVQQITDLMVATETHPDPRVKAARKAVANALVILNKVHAAAATSDLDVDRAAGLSNAQILDRELAAVEKRGNKKRGSGAAALKERLAGLGITAKDLRTWAVGQGLDVPGAGPLPARIVDAYETHLIGTAKAS